VWDTTHVSVKYGCHPRSVAPNRSSGSSSSNWEKMSEISFCHMHEARDGRTRVTKSRASSSSMSWWTIADISHPQTSLRTPLASGEKRH